MMFQCQIKSASMSVEMYVNDANVSTCRRSNMSWCLLMAFRDASPICFLQQKLRSSSLQAETKQKQWQQQKQR